MAVGPSKSPLDVPVQIAKETVLDLEPTPDLWLDLVERHPELKDLFGGLGLSRCPCGEGSFLGLFGGFLFGHGGWVQVRMSANELCLENLKILVREELIGL